jgi:LPXTG-motif cell wall-anchored protein
MQTRRLTHVLTAAAVGAVAVVTVATPGLAQEGPPPGQQQCSNPAGQYPPPTQSCRGLSTAEAAPGQQMRAGTPPNSFDEGSSGEVGAQQGNGRRGNALAISYIKLGTFVADSSGAATATFTLPEQMPPGEWAIVFKGVKNGAPAAVSLPFEVVSVAGTPGSGSGTGVGGGTVNNPRTGVFGALPRTGDDAVVPLVVTGLALVVVGSAVTLTARRRREELDSTSVA